MTERVSYRVVSSDPFFTLDPISHPSDFALSMSQRKYSTKRSYVVLLLLLIDLNNESKSERVIRVNDLHE